MAITSHVKKSVPALLICLLSYSGFSQNGGTGKRFLQADSLTANTGGQLILFEDHHFINSGIYKDLGAQEVYVWYASGTWVMEGDEILCNSEKLATRTDEIIAEIKQSYKKRKDFRLIDTYYEFVNEKYSHYSFKISGDTALDSTKRISYQHVK